MNVKVIATSFRKGRELREGAKHVFPSHQQNCQTSETVLQMLQNIVAIELKADAGVPMDVIIVNSDQGFAEGNDYIKQINGLETKNGKIIAYTRPNVGWSFGAFSDAFELYRRDYQYWIFTEDDIVVGGEDYGKKLIARWEELEGIRVPVGYLALLRVIKHRYGIHCGGAIGFTSKDILNKVWDRHNCLPHYKEKDDKTKSLQQNRQRVIMDGEVAFTNAIDDLGFLLLDYGENNSWNLERNLCLPYYNYVK